MNDAVIAGFLLAAACGVATCALAIARLARIPRLLQRIAAALDLSPPDTIESLVTLAALARRKGLLLVEDEPALARLPILHAGIRLALAGSKPAIIRETLERDAETPAGAATLPWLLQPIGLTAAATALALLMLTGANLGNSPIVAPMLGLALLAAAVALPLSAQHPSPLRHDPALFRAMQIETAAMIAAGCRPDDLRAALCALQSAGDSRIALARAA